MKRIVLILLGLSVLIAAAAGSLAMVSATHTCGLSPTGTACYTPLTKVFGGVALLVCGLGVLAVAVLKGWSDHRAVVEKKRWRHLETIRLPAAADPFPTRPKTPRS